MRKKGLIAILCALLVALPLGAVFQEDSLNHTLTVLLMELKESYANLIRISGSAEKRIQEQHEKLASVFAGLGEHLRPYVRTQRDYQTIPEVQGPEYALCRD